YKMYGGTQDRGGMRIWEHDKNGNLRFKVVPRAGVLGVGQDSNIPTQELTEVQKELIASVEELIKTSPELRTTPRKNKSGYAHFPTIGYFKNGFIDQEIINALAPSRNGTLLSIGVGDGHLEKVLQVFLHMSPQNITLVDKKFYLDEVLDFRRFRKVKMDMFDSWHKLGSQEEYDVTLLAQSLGIAGVYRKIPKNGLPKDPCQKCKEIVDALWGSGAIPSLQEHKEVFLKKIPEMFAGIEAKYNVLKQAMLRLRVGGMLGVEGHYMNHWEVAYVLLRLKYEFPSMRGFRLIPNWGSFVIYK
ncbi:MAG TPA: hypothetical protein VJL87_01755, partial [Bdellovibrionota bacterium]|nr:hypothetical protein [Bdellovibrionota bacterium]